MELVNLVSTLDSKYSRDLLWHKILEEDCIGWTGASRSVTVNGEDTGSCSDVICYFDEVVKVDFRGVGVYGLADISSLVVG